jgi:hypothetical protein
MRLNVGCGEFKAKGWWNVDMVEIGEGYNITPDQIVDVSLPLPENIDALTMVYMGHFLEHIHPAHIQIVFDRIKERMLKGARICVVGPDVRRAKVMYDNGQIDKAQYDNCRAGAGAAHWPGDYHYWDCYEEGVVLKLTWAGFRNITPVPMNSRALDDWPVTARTDWQCAVIGEFHG